MPEIFEAYTQAELNCRAVITAIWQVVGDRETLKTVAEALCVCVTPYTDDPTQDGIEAEEATES